MAAEQVRRIEHDLYQEPANYLLTSRVTVETTGPVGYKWFWLKDPIRLVFDLSPAGAAPADGMLAVDGGLVKAVRWGRHPGDVVRVVLDLARPAAFRAGWLSGPPRLVVDLDRLEVTLYDHVKAHLEVLPLDAYLTGVLAAEVPPTFQPEALKAQAVAARTYALRKLRVFGGAGCSRGAGADVCTDPGHCQGYASLESLRATWKEDFEHRWELLAAAVDATRQLYLTYGSALAETVYHSTCGGHTASAAEVWGRAAPYLSGVPCEYCQISPHYRKTTRLSLADASQALGQDLAAVRATTASGRAAEVAVAGRRFSGNAFRGALGLPSTLVENVAGDLAVTTRGFGHGVGLCQWGAEGLARVGRGFREILLYYYPGTAVGGVSFGPDAGVPAEPAPAPPAPAPTPAPSPSAGPGALLVVVLDPGHGGSDPGATGPGGLAEKDVNLAIALVVAEVLAGRVNLLLTRRDDRTVSLGARTSLANQNKAALFVSVHGNGSVHPEAAGTETYHYPGSRLGAALAGYVQHRLVAALRRRDRGVKQADFFVLRETRCPAALAEVAFVTSPEEAKLLADRAFRRKAGEAVAAGILDYLGQMR